MKLAITAPSSKTNTDLDVSDDVFAADLNEGLVHQVVVSYAAGARQGTRAQKSRADVRGGGAKPWRQKGTGRARAGTSSSPIWRKGGVTFAARPQDHSQKVNRKMYRKAIKVILSELIRQGRLLVVDNFEVATHKTKDFVAQLKSLNLDDVMIVTTEVSENMFMASRNLYKVDVRDAEHIDPVSLIGYGKVLMTVAAVKQIEEKLA